MSTADCGPNLSTLKNIQKCLNHCASHLGLRSLFRLACVPSSSPAFPQFTWETVALVWRQPSSTLGSQDPALPLVSPRLSSLEYQFL